VRAYVRAVELLSYCTHFLFGSGSDVVLHAQGCTIRSPTLACTTSRSLAANTATRPGWTPRRRLLRAPACCLGHDRWHDRAYLQVAVLTTGLPSSMMYGCRAGSGEADKLKAAMERHNQVNASSALFQVRQACWLLSVLTTVPVHTQRQRRKPVPT